MMILYHGTSGNKAKQIMKNGFNKDMKATWKVKSKKGFIYLSLAYAPFYAMAKNKSNEGALIKVEVEDCKLYPDDDYIMYKLGSPVYTQEQIDAVELGSFKNLAQESLKFMGNACAKIGDVKILGYRIFKLENLILKCDPSITPINYLIMGEYYKRLSEWIYEGKDIIKFKEGIYDGIK